MMPAQAPIPVMVARANAMSICRKQALPKDGHTVKAGLAKRTINQATQLKRFERERNPTGHKNACKRNVDAMVAPRDGLAPDASKACTTQRPQRER